MDENSVIIIFLINIIIFIIIYIKQSGKHQTEMFNLRKKKQDGLKSQLKGDLSELVIPWLSASGCSGSELRHFGKPIDWIGFKGLDDPTAQIEIKIIEVKTGKTKNLTKNEKRIKNAVERKDIEWITIHIKQKEVEERLRNIGVELT
jgi:predicted Holliday junction resolvase-like endonuclease|tara:strand:+ start:202 stop:642 length:441 start_codon:yes stop_codon:yes gene_type:complete